MKKTIRVIIFLLVILLSLSVVSLHGLEIEAKADVADSGSCGDNVVFKLSSDGVLTISGTGDMYDVEDGYGLPYDTTPWDRDKVTRVIIKDGVTSIGEYMFSSHTHLTDVQIANSVVSIGKGAFSYCYSLLSLTLPKNLTAIPENMCALAGLRYVYIPAGVKSINDGAFYVNDLIEVEYAGTKSQWKKVVIENDNEYLSEACMVYNGSSTISKTQSGKCGDGVTWKLSTDGTLKISGKGNIDSYKKDSKGTDHPWYKYRSKIKKIVITSDVVSVGAYAFFDCFNCTSLKIENGVKAIKEGAFAYMPISSLSLPKSVTTLGKYAFYKCGALQKAKLSNSIKVLDDGLFEECRNLKSIVLPKKLTKINYAVFPHSDFDEITIPANVTYIDSWSLGTIKTVRFLGALPSFENDELPDTFINADYCYCLPEHYKSYKAIFEKWRAKGVLSDGPICAKLNKTSITLTEAEPTYKLTVSDGTGTAKSVTKKWWVEKEKVASVDKKGVVTASGHGKTMVHVEITAGGYHSMANCQIETKRNDLMVALLPEKIKADFPVTHSISGIPFGEVDINSYQPGKLVEIDTKNKYYKQILTLTNDLTSGCSNDKQKAKAIWGWVTENITYGGSLGSGEQVGQVYEVFLNRESHCEGFSKLTGFMLYLADIPSCFVTSYGHMWNIALLDGKWTMIDSTNSSFGEDYNDFDTIESISFGIDDFCFVIDNTEGIKLTGVGNYYYDEELQDYACLNIPDFVDIIFGSAFSGCNDLKSIALPKSVTEIKSNAFEDCNNLTNVFYAGSKSQWKAIRIDEGNENLTKAEITLKTTKIMPTVSLSKVASSGKIKLGWNGIGARSYQVYRATSKNGNFKLIKTTAKTGYTDTSAVVGKTYYYKVRGVFSDGKKSAFSTVKSVRATKSAKSFSLSTTTYTYNGKVKTPSVVVKNYAGKTLKKNTDYTVTYASGRKKVGSYKVTIKMIGKYSGTKTLTIKIKPAKSSVSKLTTANKSLKVTIKKVTSQASGYEIQYSTSKTFKAKYTKTKKVTSNTTTKVTLKSLKAKKTYYVRVRTYKTVDGKKYYSAWSSYKSKKTK